MENIEEIQILCNGCYGGWGISDKACELYKLRKNDEKIKNELSIYENKIRTDPILIQIFYELGPEFNDNYSKIYIKKIPKIYEKYYDIQEYDGLESVSIDYSKYKFDNLKNKINEILQSDCNNDKKINKLQRFMSAFDMINT